MVMTWQERLAASPRDRFGWAVDAEGQVRCPGCGKAVKSSDDQRVHYGHQATWHRKCIVAAGEGDPIDAWQLESDAYWRRRRKEAGSAKRDQGDP